MNKRAVLIVLDGFGVGNMEDVVIDRTQDLNTNTAKHIIENNKDIKINNLCNLGLMNLLDFETDNLKKSEVCIYGKSKLQHPGADTFLGHQEMMGSHIEKPLITPFSTFIDEVEEALLKKGYKVEKKGKEVKFLWVNDCVAIGDNLETDLGQVYNLTTTFKKISFEEELEIAKIVRSIVKVARVICFGGENATVESILSAHRQVNNHSGIDAPMSKVYEKGYMVRHLGYKVNSEKQLPTLLEKKYLSTCLIGKVADIVHNNGKSIKNLVDTDKIMNILINELKLKESNFICANIQETDLSGHSQDVLKYAKKLEIVDSYLPKIIDELGDEDILIITADHGNDPTNKSSKHTREFVPLLVYNKKNKKIINLGIRGTLSDTSATILEFFGIDNDLEQGKSYLK